jgi:hypothetical protein
MKRIAILLMVVGFIANGFAQDASVFQQYKMPTFEYKYLDVYGTDFLHYISKDAAGDSRMYMNFGGNFLYRNQSPMMTYYLNDNLNYKSDSKGSSTGDATSTMKNTLGFGAKKWIMDDKPKGLYGFADGSLTYSKTTDIDATKMLPLNIGAGYGRVTEERTVAQAIVILNELGADASNENILKLADIIAKNAGGYYERMYKDDAAIMFYKDVAGVTGKAEDALKVQRIISGGIYLKNTTRANGWLAEAGYSHPDLLADSSNSGGIKIGGEYAKPMDLDKQFRAWAWYSKDLNTAPTNKFTLGASFSIDHNYLWTSNAKLDFTNFMPDVGDGWSDWSLKCRSDYFILNQMSAYGELSFTTNNSGMLLHKDADMIIDFRIGGRYIIDLQ